MLYTERTRRYTDRRSSGALRPPFYSDLLWYSKKRVGSTVIDEITKNDATPNNGELIFDPATEIIDLSKYPKGSDGDWNTVTFKTIEGDKVYRVISTFADLDKIRSGLSSNYILADNIDAKATHTQNPTTANEGDYDKTLGYLENDIVNYNGDRYKCIQDFTQDDYIDINNEDYWKENNYEGWGRTSGFTGILNGNGFEIRSLKANRPTNNQTGFFTSTRGATIANLGMRDAVIIGKTVNPSSPYHGVLAGRIDYSIITNCYSTNCTVTGNDYVGGLVGESRSSSTTNCYSTNSTIMGNDSVGGLVGYNWASSTTNCYSTNCIVTGDTDVGGLLGRNYSSSITNCYSTNCIVTGDTDVGGLLGRIWASSTITNCYYIGKRPEAQDTSYLSLFCAVIIAPSTITNSYACEIDDEGNDVDGTPLRFTNTTDGVTDSGNKTTTDMKIQATYIDWDFTNIWGLNATINNGYPYLRSLQVGYTNWLSNYRIVSLPPADVDGYIVFPVIPGAGELSIFDRDNPTLYTDDARNPLDYLGAGYGLYWRIDKLNTVNILSWMQPDYKFSWFVKNTFTDGTLDPITIKEIMAYNAPITGADNLSKMMKYLNLPEEVI